MTQETLKKIKMIDIRQNKTPVENMNGFLSWLQKINSDHYFKVIHSNELFVRILESM